jgi:hypothetical protein
MHMEVFPRLWGTSLAKAVGLLAALGISAAWAHGGEVRMLDGTTRQGDAVSLEKSELRFKGSDGKVLPIPMDTVLRLDLGAVPARPPLEKFADLELNDGTLLRCASLKAVDKAVEVTLHGGMIVKVPLEKVANWLTNGADEAGRKDWDSRLAKRKRRDMLAIARQGAINSLDGTLGTGDGEGKTIGFTPQGIDREARVPLTNIHGLAFERAPDPNLEPILARLFDTGGNRLAASGITLKDGAWQVRLSGGLEISYPAGGMGGLSPARLDLSRGKLAYLSDMDATLAVDPGKEDTTRFRVGPTRDKNLDLSPLRLAGVSYAKGLGLLAPTVMEFELGGEFREFRCVAGFDDAVPGASGPVLLLIEGDGKELARRELTRGPSRVAVPVACAVKDVQKLRVSVLPVGDELGLGYGKHLHLAEARVSK